MDLHTHPCWLLPQLLLLPLLLPHTAAAMPTAACSDLMSPLVRTMGLSVMKTQWQERQQQQPRQLLLLPLPLLSLCCHAAAAAAAGVVLLMTTASPAAVAVARRPHIMPGLLQWALAAAAAALRWQWQIPAAAAAATLKLCRPSIPGLLPAQQQQQQQQQQQ
jgi:hypothetical protein